ncbi:MAG: prephenate dehydrogenase/arogenate dehydrogenase family protein [Ignavibacteria bacterium]|nr:prephenate dehydrogenase/arogenate dehydrogenase family protein [Ignavibacteria bacterium]
MKASLFGFGRFGKLFYKFFKDDFEFSIYDKNISETELRKLTRLKTIRPYNLSESDIVFLAVPISSIQEISKEIKHSINRNTLIVEMCSVKIYPQKILRRYFPQNKIVGIHPLFGPDSVKNSLNGHQIIIVDNSIKSEKLSYLINILTNKGLKLIQMTSNEHDKLMAYTLCLTQFIGRALGNIKLPDKSIGTKGYFDLLDIVKRTNNDTFQLFIDMNKFNPHSEKMRKEVIQEFSKIDRIISNRFKN